MKAAEDRRVGAEAAEYSPFRRGQLPLAKTHSSNSDVYYDAGGKAWILEQEYFHGKVTHKRWIRAEEYDVKDG